MNPDAIIDAIGRANGPSPGSLTITVNLPSWVQYVELSESGILWALAGVTPFQSTMIGTVDNPTGEARIWHVTDDGWREFTLTIAEAT